MYVFLIALATVHYCCADVYYYYYYLIRHARLYHDKNKLQLESLKSGLLLLWSIQFKQLNPGC
jgi:hypothetical protein